MKLSDFKMLTFDTYGTLIDWESGIYNGLGPLLDKLPIKLRRDEVLELFGEYERQQQAENPQQLYSAVLADVSRAMDAYSSRDFLPWSTSPLPVLFPAPVIVPHDLHLL